uniref:Protein Vpu n=1 Tax=Human immunodeficiency virus type 1 TaxID=11676 RepID=Q8ADT0_HV1|nr:vpu protein [Human immunodeficiency virus 1]
MQSLVILAIVALVVAFIIAIVVWTIVFIECRKLQKQKRIDWLIKRISERAEDSGNESDGEDGETAELSRLVEMGNNNLGYDNDL